MNSDSGIKEAGRGFVLITGAKLWFLLTATFAGLAFPRLFGDQVLFGQFRVVSGLLNVVNMVVITATVQAVSKLASEAGSDIRQVCKTAMVGQVLIFGPVFLAIIAFNGMISSRFLSDPGIAGPLLVASFVMLAYTFYAALIGIFNGRRHFGRQAGMDILFATLKTGLMVGVVVASGSVVLAYGAFATAAWIVLAAAAVLTMRMIPSTGGTGRLQLQRYFSYLLPLAGYALVLNLLLQADVISIKAVLGSLPGTEGAVSVADSASIAAGVYGAAKNVSLLPYQAVISLAFIVFPLVSTASSQGDDKGAGNVASGAFRLASILSWCAVAVFASAPDSFLSLLFGKGYQAGAESLVILLGAGAMLAFMHVGNAVLASSGRPVISVLGGVGAAVVQLAMLALFVPGRDTGGAMVAAALATLVGSTVGALLSGILNARLHGCRGWLWTVFSSVVAGIGAVVAARALDSHVPWPVLPVVAFVVFAGVLVLTRGAGRADLDLLRRMFNRRTAS